MPEPLHGLILDYKMQCDVIQNCSESNLLKIIQIFSLSLDYSEILVNDDLMTMNDIKAWDALTTKYLKSI